ncbi:hypothetical protein Y1Q_0019067 [Alligator mississippiensis]|uniref:Uncharacterized protein n=1 Tax=Alligator mississippiensis TaxID=8496 RepID=A0A151N0W3_ALLMI|nr:hypothetical protein Y1Q_0019067 [Alligator mississippiensis]
MVAWAVEATEKDRQVLDTILALAVSFMTPIPGPSPLGPWQLAMAQPLVPALPPPWQLATAQHQWAWDELCLDPSLLNTHTLGMDQDFTVKEFVVCWAAANKVEGFCFRRPSPGDEKLKLGKELAPRGHMD